MAIRASDTLRDKTVRDADCTEKRGESKQERIPWFNLLNRSQLAVGDSIRVLSSEAYNAAVQGLSRRAGGVCRERLTIPKGM